MLFDAAKEFQLRATFGMDDSLIAAIREHRGDLAGTAVGHSVERREPIQISDVRTDRHPKCSV